MRYIELTQGKKTIIDEEDFHWLSRYKWHYHKTCKSCGYARTNIKSVKFRMHELLMNPKKKMYVDHINRDTLDNRKENLRICSPTESSYNLPPRGKTSKYKGVSWNKEKKKWYTRIYANKKMKHIGYFKIEKEAAMAYDKEADVLHGEFAYLNNKRS